MRYIVISLSLKSYVKRLVKGKDNEYGAVHVLLHHYANMPMQYAAIFKGCKNVDF